ncbi:MAG: nucleotidyltransferase family protein [Thermodesulfovibrionales bacterium]|nr:nucleotidyltransferase family protein [Thermodesulfovibrionales bacterium]
MIVYNEPFSLSEELLVLTLKEQRPDSERRRVHSIYRQSGDEAIFQVAVVNKVVPMVAHGLIDSVPEEELDERWQTAHTEVEKKLTSFFRELDHLAEIFDMKSIRVVAIENGGIARGVQKCRGCFASSDMEILVDHEDLKMFEQCLIDEGYERGSRERCASENSSQWDRDIRGWDNYRKQLPEGYQFWLNVQWRAVLRRWVPMEQGLNAKELIARSVPIRDASSSVRILSPEDNLLVCALHVASHSYVRGIGLRLQLDVDRLVRNVSIDWDLFLELARRHGASKLVFPSLAIPATLFDTPVPETVFSALVPSAHQRSRILSLIARAGIMNRSDHKFSAWEMVQLEIMLSEGGFLKGLKRILFPPADWICEGYRLKGYQYISACYLHRLLDLARRRQA